MYFAGCEHEACFLRVLRFAPLINPVRATYSGPTFPKYVAFGLTPECVNIAWQTQTSHNGRAADVVRQWSQEFVANLLNLDANLLPMSFMQLPCHIAKLISVGLWGYITLSKGARFDSACDLYPLRREIQLAATTDQAQAGHRVLAQATADALAAEGLAGGMFRWIGDSLAAWSNLIDGAAADREEAVGRRQTLEQMVCWLRMADGSAHEHQLVNSR